MIKMSPGNGCQFQWNFNGNLAQNSLNISRDLYDLSLICVNFRWFSSIFVDLCAREAAGNFLGTQFPSKLAENTALVDKKRGPGTLQPQSNSINGSRTQPAVPAKVVFGPHLGTTLLHAPGTKMT